MGYYTPKKFWFGTAPFVSPVPGIPSDPGKMQWVDAPIQGADLSTADWGNSNTFLSGGAHVSQSRGSHKTYSFEWRESSSPKTVSMLQGYRNGSFGRGLIHFITPDAYRTNALPERWAHPALSLGLEGGHLPVFKKTGNLYQLAQNPAVSGIVTPQNEWDLPLTSLQYDLSAASLQPDTATVRDSGLLYVPVPPNHYAIVNSWGSDGGFLIQFTNGAQTYTPFSPDSYEGTGLLSGYLPIPSAGFYLGLATESDTLSVSALSVQIIPLDEIVKDPTPEGIERILTENGVWQSGMGNSGTRFAPGGVTMGYNSPVAGGRMSVAASFTEVGDSIR